MSCAQAEKILQEIAARASLREGADGVRRLLEIIATEQRVSLMDAARVSRLPVPVTSAIRREMEKEGILSRGGGMFLTDRGRSLLDAIGGAALLGGICAACAGRRYSVPEKLQPVLEIVRAYHRSMPPVDVTADQAFATPETSLRRAVYMWDCGDLSGRQLICLGDDDLVSVSSGLLLREYGSGRGQVTVLDADERILEHISRAASKEDLPIRCVHHDLRDPLPATLIDAFDTAETDPPFTRQGIRLFVSRAVEAMGGKPGRPLYLSFPHRSAAEMFELQGDLSDLGLAIQELVPDFNDYVGATILGNRSQIARLQIAAPSTALIEGRFTEPIYSKSASAEPSAYRCLSCGALHTLGPTDTVEALKDRGCPSCGGSKLRRVSRRRRS